MFARILAELIMVVLAREVMCTGQLKNGVPSMTLENFPPNFL